MKAAFRKPPLVAGNVSPVRAKHQSARTNPPKEPVNGLPFSYPKEPFAADPEQVQRVLAQFTKNDISPGTDHIESLIVSLLETEDIKVCLSQVIARALLMSFGNTDGSLFNLGTCIIDLLIWPKTSSKQIASTRL